jgi:hypothetical protein
MLLFLFFISTALAICTTQSKQYTFCSAGLGVTWKVDNLGQNDCEAEAEYNATLLLLSQNAGLPSDTAQVMLRRMICMKYFLPCYPTNGDQFAFGCQSTCIEIANQIPVSQQYPLFCSNESFWGPNVATSPNDTQRADDVYCALVSNASTDFNVTFTGNPKNAMNSFNHTGVKVLSCNTTVVSQTETSGAVSAYTTGVTTSASTTLASSTGQRVITTGTTTLLGSITTSTSGSAGTTVGGVLLLLLLAINLVF